MLTHVGSRGLPRMVCVAEKHITVRRAVAISLVFVPSNLFDARGGLFSSKGAVLTVASIAGINAAKATSSLIPMCHPLPIDGISVEFSVSRQEGPWPNLLLGNAPGDVADLYRCVATTVDVQTTNRTGVEMEALTGASVASLTIYDMVKGAAAPGAVAIGPTRLLSKAGGKTDFKVAETGIFDEITWLKEGFDAAQ